MSTLRLIATACSLLLLGTDVACAAPHSAEPVAFSLPGLDGKTVALSDFAGKPVYVKFWATWCSICLGGLGEVEALNADQDDGIEVLTIVSPGYLGERTADQFTGWAKSRDLDFPVLLDVDGKLAASLEVGAYPTSMWIDPKGNVVSVAQGQVSNAQVAERFAAGWTDRPTSHSRFPPNPNVGVDYSKAELDDIWLAGGCFWGVEAYMTRIYGVADAQSGYANGPTPDTTYEEVCAGSGHTETVHVRYDPDRVPLERILGSFFQIIDPTVKNRQGNDVGVQYRTGIYYRDPAARAVAERVLAEEQARYTRPIVTELLPLTEFDKAEAYHQDYLEKHPDGYCHTDFSSLTNASRPDGAERDAVRPAH